MRPENLIEIDGLTKAYAGHDAIPALSDIHLTIRKGEIFALMGTSGSGKSTLLRHINRLIEPTSGSIRVGDNTIGELTSAQVRVLRSERIGMVFQHFGLLPHRTALENVVLPLELRGFDVEIARKKATEQLIRAGLGHALHRYPDELSGGMQQRVGLARALVGDPDILLMDEPFGALDPTIRRDLQDQIIKLVRERGITTIVVTHDPAEAVRMADRLALLHAGRLVQVGTAREILDHPADDGVVDFFHELLPDAPPRATAIDPDPAHRSDADAYSERTSAAPSIAKRLLQGPSRFAQTRPSLFWTGLVLETAGLAFLLQNAVAGRYAIAALFALLLLAFRATLSVPRAIASPKEWLAPFALSLVVYALIVWRVVDNATAASLYKRLGDRAVALAVSNQLDQAIAWAQITFQPAFVTVVVVTRTIIESIEGALAWLPWPVPALALIYAAWRFAGATIAALSVVAVAYLVIFGFWQQTISTVSLVGAAVFITVLLGLPLGILSARSNLLRRVLEPLLDVMQTLPSFVYLIPAVAFFSVGKTPAVVATVVFAMPPMIRLTSLGIREVSATTIEAAYAHGATSWQVLTKVELPLALPSLMLGINQVIVMSLSMVVVSALIGAGGLGYDVVTALRNIQGGAGFLAGLAIVFCALVPDRIIQKTMQKNRRYSKN